MTITAKSYRNDAPPPVKPAGVAPDNVYHPAHYNQGGIECLDAMLAAFGPDAVRIYAKINAFKYLWRAEYKGKYEEDIAKAMFYLRLAAGDDPRKFTPN
jgi:hypothetical protein